MIAVFLDEQKLDYQQEHPIVKNPDTGHYLRADFYIESMNMVIEFDGPQHFKPVEYFGGEEHYQQCVYRDKIKNYHCKKEGIHLIRIPYFKKNEIRNILENFFSKFNKENLSKAA
jgi:very-short-patch-repair endonuclease